MKKLFGLFVLSVLVLMNTGCAALNVGDTYPVHNYGRVGDEALFVNVVKLGDDCYYPKAPALRKVMIEAPFAVKAEVNSIFTGLVMPGYSVNARINPKIDPSGREEEVEMILHVYDATTLVDTGKTVIWKLYSTRWNSSETRQLKMYNFQSGQL